MLGLALMAASRASNTIGLSLRSQMINATILRLYRSRIANSMFSSMENSFCKAISKLYASWAFYHARLFQRRPKGFPCPYTPTAHGVATEYWNGSRRPYSCNRCPRRSIRCTAFHRKVMSRVMRKINSGIW